MSLSKTLRLIYSLFEAEQLNWHGEYNPKTFCEFITISERPEQNGSFEMLSKRFVNQHEEFLSLHIRISWCRSLSSPGTKLSPPPKTALIFKKSMTSHFSHNRQNEYNKAYICSIGAQRDPMGMLILYTNFPSADDGPTANSIHFKYLEIAREYGADDGAAASTI